jgi:hypothetical protein
MDRVSRTRYTLVNGLPIIARRGDEEGGEDGMELVSMTCCTLVNGLPVSAQRRR